MNLKQNLLSVAFTVCIMPVAGATGITVDGNLSDWGLHTNGNASDWTPSSTLSPNLQYALDDTRIFSGFVNPGYGGQAYDAEALYAYFDNTNLYVALVTGLSPNTVDDPAHNSYAPGDLAFDFGNDGSFEFGIQTTGPNQGNVYQGATWNLGLWDVNGGYINNTHLAPDPSHPTSMVDGTGTLVGAAVLEYTNNVIHQMGQYSGDHYVLEAAIPLLAFSGFSGEFLLHWTMNCANDAVQLVSTLPLTLPHPDINGTVPEPATIALLALGMFGLRATQRKPATFLNA